MSSFTTLQEVFESNSYELFEQNINSFLDEMRVN